MKEGIANKKWIKNNYNNILRTEYPDSFIAVKDLKVIAANRNLNELLKGVNVNIEKSLQIFSFVISAAFLLDYPERILSFFPILSDLFTIIPLLLNNSIFYLLNFLFLIDKNE